MYSNREDAENRELKREHMKQNALTGREHGTEYSNRKDVEQRAVTERMWNREQ